MIRLSREVRFGLVEDYHDVITNSWSGWPSTSHIVPQLKLVCTVAGRPDPQTGFVCDTRQLDNLLRGLITTEVIPNFETGQSVEVLLRKIWRLARLRWTSTADLIGMKLELSPYLQFWLHSENETMIYLTQQFEFSAAHRLHCENLTDEANHLLFGKCNNAEGHGHNYVVEVSVERDGGSDGPVIQLNKFEAIVKQLVIDRLDHKHLNRDVEYFSKVNPTVENIAIAIWNWLNGQFDTVKLSHIRVYETPKTWADYRGG